MKRKLEAIPVPRKVRFRWAALFAPQMIMLNIIFAACLLPLLWYRYTDTLDAGTIYTVIILALIADFGLMSAFYAAGKLLRTGVPVIGTVLSRRGRINVYWTVSYKYKEAEMVREFYGYKSAENEVLLLVDPVNPVLAYIYTKRFYWELA